MNRPPPLNNISHGKYPQVEWNQHNEEKSQLRTHNALLSLIVMHRVCLTYNAFQWSKVNPRKQNKRGQKKNRILVINNEWLSYGYLFVWIFHYILLLSQQLCVVTTCCRRCRCWCMFCFFFFPIHHGFSFIFTSVCKL